jgi:hypothetical protein
MNKVYNLCLKHKENHIDNYRDLFDFCSKIALELLEEKKIVTSHMLESTLKIKLSKKYIYFGSFGGYSLSEYSELILKNLKAYGKVKEICSNEYKLKKHLQ